MAANDLEARLTANTTGFQTGMVQAAAITDTQMKKIAQMVNAANDAAARMGKTTQKAASDMAAAHASIVEGAEHVRSAHAGVNRELLVLTHEMSQGNFSRFGGSMLVLAERTNALEFAMTGAGAAVSLVGAAVLGTAALIAMGAIEADRFSKALQLTGNYAAVTEDQIRSLAEAQSKQTGQTVGASRESIQAIAGTGLFGPNEVAVAARAMGDYQRMTHATAEDALKEFASIQNGVAKWAEEQNKSAHFMTEAEYEHIKALEDSGQKQAAAGEALKEYAQTIESRAGPQLGALSSAFHDAGQSASFLSEAIKNIGRGTTSEGSLGGVQREIELLQSHRDMPGSNDRYRAAIDSHVAQLQEFQRQIRQESFRTSEFANAASANASAQQAAIESDKFIDSVMKGAKALSQRTEELKKWDAAVAARAAAGNAMKPEDVAAGRAEINKHYQDHGAITQASEYANMMATVKAFNATTEEQVSGMQKLTEGERFVIQTQEALAKSGKAFTEAQRQAITADAARAASLRDVADAHAVLQKSIKEDADRSIKESSAAVAAQQKAIEGFQRSGANRLGDINFQTSLIGKNPDEAARLQAMHTIDMAANQALEAASGQRLNEILEEQAKQRDAVTEAMARQHAQQLALTSSFSAGWDSAMSDFVKKTADDAANAKKVFDDMANGMTDAITQFAMTGKFSIHSMVDSVIQDLIRMQAQKAVASMMGVGGSGSGGSSAAGGIGSLVGSIDWSNLGKYFGVSFANGIDYVPYDGFPAILHEGEKVTRRQDAAVERKGGGDVHVHMGAMSFGAGVDASGVAQAVRTGMAQTKAEIARAMNTGRMSA